ncbi:type II toxin-antitoxin system RelE family toxin [Pseudoclavibacter terrae]|uniref:Type II toxin-antitoxin system RelE/ParE family toxin n=1 Tax=Pseudoclavibacter terrae TaxID=1530195 RepID=A0A7J5B0V5_9MICO|nr:type II toxin-antitoxin system RelE/ParE family toxin [Pseudoclavibacter terrae]KAB1637105.1 type II toxin-antitoxin system RelE/ParE family toxin [Pseudoclavibacter terrae]
MSYQILVLPAAARAIKKLPPEAKRRIQAAVELLAEDPRPPAAKKLTGRPEWRVRTGDYRVLYRIQDDVLTVVIVHADHRREVYDK